MAGTCDNVKLLFLCQGNELNSVSGNTDGKVLIFFFFRMFHCIDQLLCTEYIYIQMMGILCKISVKNLNQIILAFLCLSPNALRILHALRKWLPFVQAKALLELRLLQGEFRKVILEVIHQF